MSNIPKWVDCNKCTADACFICAVQTKSSPYIYFEDKDIKCQFDDNGICRALGCYNSKKCGSKDENGNPNYK